MPVDYTEAGRFLTLLDEDSDVFCFQTFSEVSRSGAETITGTFDQWSSRLAKLNANRHGVFVTVNVVNGKRRKAENITAVRALFLDLDGVPLAPVSQAPITPNIIVESSPGKWHVYWIVTDVPLAQFKPIQQALAAMYNGDPAVCDLPRVMRLPGFMHQKGDPYQTRIYDDNPGEVSCSDFLKAFGIDLAEPRINSRVDAGPAPGFTGWINAIGDHEGGQGFHLPIRNAIAAFIGKHGKECDVSHLKTLLRARIQGADASKHTAADIAHYCSDTYLDQSIAGAINHPTIGDSPKRKETAEAVAQRQQGFDDMPPIPPPDAYTDEAPGNTDQAAGEAPQWEEPAELPDNLSPVAAFDEGMLPKNLRAWVMDSAKRMGCAPDYIAVAAMVAIGSLIGKKLGIRPKVLDPWVEVPNLWGMNIGRPAAYKTPAVAEGLKPLKQLEAAAHEEFKAISENYQADKILAKAAKEADEKKIKGLVKSDPAKARALARRIAQAAAEEEPHERRYIANDATTEKLGEILSRNGNGVLVYRDELIGLFRSMDKVGREVDRQFYLECWGGKDSFTYDRIIRGTVRIDDAILSVLGNIQPGVLQAHVQSAVAGGKGADGLLQRFQLAVWPDDPPGRWHNTDREPDDLAWRDALKVFRAFNSFDPIESGAITDEGRIPYLHFNEAAQASFTRWRDTLENEKLKDCETEALESHLAKYRKLCPVLALLIHVCDSGISPVSEGALIKAIAWCDYLESHARRIYGAASNVDTIAARLLLVKIREGALPDPFKPHEVYRKHWTGLGKAEAFKAMDTLTDYGYLRREEIKTGGRPTVIYFINPKVRNS